MTDNDSRTEFERQAAQKRSSFLGEFGHFLMDNKKWWMIPVLTVLLLVGALLIAGGTGVAPFIYTLF